MSSDLLRLVLESPNLEHCRQKGIASWSAKCPVHGGKDRDSMTISDGGDKVLIHCHSKGCSYHDVLDALGIQLDSANSGQVADGAKYVYCSPDGEPIHAQVRKQAGREKTFHAERWNGRDWERGAPEPREKMVPYRLPQVLDAIEDKAPVYIVEGEKDADILALYGLAATTVANGSSGWREHYAKWFRGARVRMIPDRDEPGQKFKATVERALTGIAETFCVIDLPYDVTETRGKDVSDWLADGHTVTELDRMAQTGWRLEGVMTLDEAADVDRWFEKVELRDFGMVGLGPDYQVPGIGPGMLLVLAARLGVGKTAWMVDLVSRIIAQSDWKVMISTYDEPASRLRNYLAASIELDPRFTDWHVPKDQRRYHAYCASLKGKPVLLDTKPRPVEEVEFIARSWRPQVLIVDHLALVTGEERDTERTVLVQTVRRLRSLANELPCCVIGLSQLNRPGEDLIFFATAANLYGSDAIGHTADAILCLQRLVTKKAGKVPPELQIEEAKKQQEIDYFEQYRVLHTIKNRLGPEQGKYLCRMAGAIRRIYPLHPSGCICTSCDEHREMIKKRVHCDY